MKVLNLQCSHGHNFEGWFASEVDFLSQSDAALLACPLCGSHTIRKMLSAPRLNLSTKRTNDLVPPVVGDAKKLDTDLATRWLSLARDLLANTTDVGVNFAEEARKMHYGDTEERNIRGKATRQDALALAEEGIVVMPLALPNSLKETLH